MTEAEWLGSNDPQPMLELLQGKVSDRKLRLFACACCRCIWHLLTDQRIREAVEISERYAEKAATDEELIAIASQMLEESWGLGGGGDRSSAAYYAINPRWDNAYCEDGLMATSPYSWWAALSCANEASGNVGGRPSPQSLDEVVAEQKNQCNLLRCIFSNPFRHILLDLSLLRWRDATIPRLAQQMYDARDFASMPILADALEEAGCTNGDILEHCRGPGPHVRGCWVVDLILGKE
jgi:hypothetical protein